MKKTAAFVTAAFLFFGIQASENESANSTMQIFIPRTSYTGDRCELKYVFHSDADLFNANTTGENVSRLELDCSFSAFKALENQCMVYASSLERTGFEYTLTVNFIPWYSGVIDFPPFNLAALVRQSQKLGEGGAVFNVDLQPVTINSLTQKTGVTSLRPSKGPFTLPGTTFILIMLAFVFFALAALVIFICIKIPLFLVYLLSTKEQRRLKKLTAQTVRSLKKLLRSKKDDEFFCQKLSVIVRDYLCRRFTEDFKILTTGRYYHKFEEIACGSLSELQNSAVMDIIEVLQRCDYIRFAKGSIDSRRQPASLYETVLGEGERNLLINRCFNAVDVFSEDQSRQEDE